MFHLQNKFYSSHFGHFGSISLESCTTLWSSLLPSDGKERQGEETVPKSHWETKEEAPFQKLTLKLQRTIQTFKIFLISYQLNLYFFNLFVKSSDNSADEGSDESSDADNSSKTSSSKDSGYDEEGGGGRGGGSASFCLVDTECLQS